MCGITGKIYFNRKRNVDPYELKKMTNILMHRGPDDEGHYIHQNIGLGFRRLSIIDLKSGHQPLSNIDGSIWITFNGEIYNYQELRNELKQKGYQFKTKTDTEVIVNLYAEYGTDCLKYLRGMFAFVIWDNRNKKIFGARDRFGIKPFYYYIDKDQFIYASEIKSIIAVDGVKTDLNIQALDSYLAYGYVSGSNSIYTTINKLKPGHYFRLNPYEKSNITTKKYWDIDFEPDYSKTENQWYDVMQETLRESIKIRMISDVPLGAFLSGGIDSSSVVALMSQISDVPIKTFSIGFKEEKYNELIYARELAKRYKTDHHELIIEPDSLSLLPKLVQTYDEPFADSSAIPTYYVSKFAREYVTVALSGDGGDELFAGYHTYSNLAKLTSWPINNKLFNKYLFRPLHKIIPDYFYGTKYIHLLSKNKNVVGAFIGLWKDYERINLLKQDIRADLNSYYAEQDKIRLLKSYPYDFLSSLQKMDMKTYLVDDILTKVDRVSMMNSLEARIPLLDHKFAELSFKIPPEYKLRLGEKKYILKKAMLPHIPNSILTHKKQGFSIPLKLWFKNDLQKCTTDILGDQLSSIFELVNYDYVQKIHAYHQKGMRDYSQKLWSLLFLNEWLVQNGKKIK